MLDIIIGRAAAMPPYMPRLSDAADACNPMLCLIHVSGLQATARRTGADAGECGGAPAGEACAIRPARWQPSPSTRRAIQGLRPRDHRATVYGWWPAWRELNT